MTNIYDYISILGGKEELSKLSAETILDNLKQGYYDSENLVRAIFQMLMDMDDQALNNFHMEKQFEEEVNQLINNKMYLYKDLLVEVRKLDDEFLTELIPYLPESAKNIYVQHIIDVIKGKVKDVDVPLSGELEKDLEVYLTDIFLYLYNSRRFVRDHGPLPVFLEALLNDELHLVKAFVTNGEVNLGHKNYINDNFIHLVASQNALKLLEYFIDLGLDINHQNVFGMTPAHTAYVHEQFDALKILIQKGVDLRLRNEENLTVTELAIIQNNVEVLQYIIENRDRKHDGINHDPYLSALNFEAFDVFDYLWSINYPSKAKKEVILLTACQKGQLNIVKQFIEDGMSVHVSYKNDTPLYAAVLSGQIDVTKYLLEQGVDPNPNGYSPLNEAISTGNLELVKLLVDHGANPYTQGKRILTPLMAAGYISVWILSSILWSSG